MEPMALHMHTSPSTTKLSGDTQGGVPDTGCQPLDAIHCLPESFPPRCGDHTSSPSSSKSFVNLPDFQKRAAAPEHLAEEQMRPGAPGDSCGLDPGPGTHHPLTTLPSITSPPVLRVFLRLLGEQMRRVAFRRLSDSCSNKSSLPSLPFHVLIVTADTKKCLPKARA